MLTGNPCPFNKALWLPIFEVFVFDIILIFAVLSATMLFDWSKQLSK
ncbi:hypothetical protein WH297_16065 [Ochrobactrum vermis]|uniref:Uncharacterized protein n=1 Tax=Ochrobactrum vermis TaxID=1827297 RepID=A0ABU8PIF9_9HYPH|nr:hypothetical protein [Ochrobactrum vermis]